MDIFNLYVTNITNTHNISSIFVTNFSTHLKTSSKIVCVINPVKNIKCIQNSTTRLRYILLIYHFERNERKNPRTTIDIGNIDVIMRNKLLLYR
jgi:hypothetical protein